MNKLLHIIATPRGDDSSTLKISNTFLEAFKTSHQDWTIDTLDLTQAPLPPLSVKCIDGKYLLLNGKDLDETTQIAWADIIAHIERFLAADAYLLSVPMWNFSIPHTLKHYIDIIMQPKYLFRYTAAGTVEGLAKNKKMVTITSRGGDYSGAMSNADFQEAYLRFVFKFIGITDNTFINAQPMNMAEAVKLQKIAEAQIKAKELALVF